MSIEARKEHYHVQLACDAGLMSQVSRDAYRLTAQGHDFIEAISDESIWEKTKKAIAKMSGHVTLEMIKVIAIKFLEGKIS